MSTNCNIQTVKTPNCGYIMQGATIPERTINMLDGYTGDLTTALEVSLVIYQGNTPVLSFSLLNGITINSATSLTFNQIDAVNNNLPHGKFTGDFYIVEFNAVPSEAVKTVYFRNTYVITKKAPL